MRPKFLGFEFKVVELSDRKILHPFLQKYPQKISGYTFATLVAWAEAYGFEWAQISEDCVLISRPMGLAGNRHLLQPIGNLDDDRWNQILAAADELPYIMQIFGVSRDFVESHSGLLRKVSILDDRDAANYLHIAADLADLHGRRFAKKRNLIAQFIELYPEWEMRQLSSSCGPDCVEVLMGLALENQGGDTSPSLQSEIKALEFTMKHFDYLEQKGISIRYRGNVVGFSVFEPLSLDTVAIHFEKADRKFKGAFQLLNRETAKIISASGYKTINREEDLGDEGLRHAKLSYPPTEIYPVYNLALNSLAHSLQMAR